MVEELAADQQRIQTCLQEALDVAQDANDEVVSGVLIERMTVHRKNQWMLRSSL